MTQNELGERLGISFQAISNGNVGKHYRIQLVGGFGKCAGNNDRQYTDGRGKDYEISAQNNSAANAAMESNASFD